ncbi:MAG: ribonuclease P protein component [Gammaproteobacteria bacterium]|nr:ribonuclease P protein component [Gammaproteobacteria bacterium]MBT5826313.1 ribonuclease P protein component [Gammaproteobacteria bacterium]MBT5967032.1 ribonuclease P protein component [Gammaproteobacteria bacterium]MBT6420159.1 ribonuclease P protein component [Gammaproteobacteria bacterium]MBT7435632.1 ribonuclease P protein component [Gammaproteobacteria bacterium]
MTQKAASFPPHLRLREPAEFKCVFANPERSTDKYFTVLAIVNELNHARLGLAIAKKNIKRAVDRNKIKRSARESFRLQQQAMTNIDIVVMARREASAANSKTLQASLDKHWLKLIKRCVTDS